MADYGCRGPLPYMLKEHALLLFAMQEAWNGIMVVVWVTQIRCAAWPFPNMALRAVIASSQIPDSEATSQVYRHAGPDMHCTAPAWCQVCRRSLPRHIALACAA